MEWMLNMKILLLNIDSKLPNIALKKVELYHQLKGGEVIWDLPIMLTQADRAYASCIFAKNKHTVEQYKGLRPDLIAGGTGYDYSIKLPPEIDSMRPKINYGFTSRGCIRHCSFCLVPKSEGTIKATGDIYELWDGKSKRITLLDNNILALPDHFKKICSQVRKENLTVDFNQGLDIRLLTEDLFREVLTIKHKELRFAFDNPSLAPLIKEKVSIMRSLGYQGRMMFYVLVGYDTTFEQDLERLNLLRELDCRAYVMRYQTTPKEKRYTRLAEWANQFWTFAKYDFNAFCTEYEKK